MKEQAALIRSCQRFLLESAGDFLGYRLPSPRVQDAFFAVPRHLFVERYSTLTRPEWRTVTEENLGEHLPALYANCGLGIFFREGDPRIATISSPGIVLYMLELLDLHPGHRVFELGTGSGWNAALMGALVAPGGRVQSLEIIPECVEAARRGLARAEVSNVEVVQGDGSLGPPAGHGLFDRAVFTAGASDLPRSFYERIREGGLLVFVLAIPGGGNVLILFERTARGFESRVVRRCAFVPVTGDGTAAISGDGARLESLPDWPMFSQTVLEERAFFASGAGPNALHDRSVDLRSYLWVVDRTFRSFIDAKGNHAYGLHDPGVSLALVRDGKLCVHGLPSAGERLRNHIHAWAAAGIPGLADFEITAFRSDREMPVDSPGMILQRPDSSFAFHLRQ